MEQDGAGGLLYQRVIGDHTQETKQLYGRETSLASTSHANWTEKNCQDWAATHIEESGPEPKSAPGACCSSLAAAEPLCSINCCRAAKDAPAEGS